MTKLTFARAVCALLVMTALSLGAAINFDDVPSGTFIANYYPGVTFSFQGGDAPMAYEYVGPSPFSSPNVLTAYDGVRGPTAVFNMYADFSTPVNNLQFLVVAADEFGTVARVNVYSGATLLGIDNVIGGALAPDTFGNPATDSTLMNLSAYSNVTRVEVVPAIGQTIVDDSYGGGGLIYDNFSWEEAPEPGCVGGAALGMWFIGRRNRNQNRRAS